MNPAKLRRNLVLTLAMAVSLAVPVHAAKRRAAGTRSPGAQFTLEKISGQILDSVTNQPIVSASISAGNRVGITDSEGRFELRNVRGFGYLIVEADRTGYLPYTARFNQNDPTTVTIRLTPTKTVTVRRTNGQTLEVDMESFKFGYPVPFSGYREAESDDFCTLNGQKLYIHRAQMAKLTGPAVLVAGGSCCDSGNAAKMTLTLKTGQTMEVLFTDTCEERYRVDIGARIHTTGEFVHIPITEISEIIFP